MNSSTQVWAVLNRAKPYVWRTILLGAIIFAGIVFSLTVVMYEQDNSRFADRFNDITNLTMSPEEEVVAVLNYVHQIPYYEIANGQFPPKETTNTWLYSTIPVNVIPPQVVLDEKLVYRGPCGAKSRLTAALLEGGGYDARLSALYGPDYRALHTVVEVRLDQGWVPLDPTYGIAYYTLDNRLATTEQVSTNEALFQRNIRNRRYVESYRYDNVNGLTPFYIFFTAGRIVNLWSFADAVQVEENLSSWVPSTLLHTDLGTTILFERPKLVPATITALLLLTLLLGRFLVIRIHRVKS